MQHKLIVIEGLDGAGKNTQTNMLLDFFQKNKIEARRLSFPDYSSPSSSLVKMYLNSELGSNPGDVNPYAAASFYAVDRFVSFKSKWQKNYESGHLILCDRYTTSNTFYQMCKLPKEKWDEYLKWLYDYEYIKLGLPVPNAVIYLNMPVCISQNLMKKRYSGDESKKDLHESNIEFLKKCEHAANYAGKIYGWHVVDCVKNGEIKTKEQIHSEVIAVLQKSKII